MNVNEVKSQELHKPVIKKLKRRKVYARFKDNIWAADLAEMGLLFSEIRGVNYVSKIISQNMIELNLWLIKNLTV